MKRKVYRYDESFKEEALEKCEKKTVEEAAKELKISPNTLYNWKKAKRTPSSSGLVRELDKAIKDLTSKIVVLKETRRFFSLAA